MSIDAGQTEAGRSLGFGYIPTMRYIILPQAFKNVLPTLGNEFIVLLKETAVVGYIGLSDLTYAANTVGGNTYEYLYPLLLAAALSACFFRYVSIQLRPAIKTMAVSKATNLIAAAANAAASTRCCWNA